MDAVKRPFTVLIEGNIGVGKSTFLQYFKQYETVEVIPEPVDAWQNLNGSNMLDLVYKNTEKWAFPFQSYTMLLMLENHLKPTEKAIKIMERSLFSAKHCFIEVLTQCEQIKNEERSILNK
ncbi:deoxynucleoside kinase-like, partial [Contarinia nasturtii]|uniref:deoxynucleoside kinase-like n=1 Tax=Contarinia nasturtii TaxID=265458 RepID=UPI0012D43DA9